MIKKTTSQHVKRTQNDYSLSFKLSVISEVERGEIFITTAKNKYWIQIDEHQQELYDLISKNFSGVATLKIGKKNIYLLVANFVPKINLKLKLNKNCNILRQKDKK